MTAEVMSKFEQPIVVPPAELYHNVKFIDLFTQSFQVLVQVFQSTIKPFELTTQLNNLRILFSKYNKDFLSYCAWIVFGAVVLTVVRSLINRMVLDILFKFKLLKPVNAARFSESFYAFIFYLVAFTLEYCIEQNTKVLSRPEQFWSKFDLSNPISVPLKILFLLQSSHYVHSLFALFYFNPWNLKDSALLAFHHVGALGLFGLCTFNKTIAMLAPMLYLFDICDVVIEGLKCVMRLELNPNLKNNIKYLLFGLLLAVWFTARLYYCPLRLAYPFILYLTYNPVDSWIPFTFTVFIMGWLLFVMTFYWTVVLVKILFKALHGGPKEIEDIRELDENGNVFQLTEKKRKTN